MNTRKNWEKNSKYSHYQFFTSLVPRIDSGEFWITNEIHYIRVLLYRSILTMFRRIPETLEHSDPLLWHDSWNCQSHFPSLKLTTQDHNSSYMVIRSFLFHFDHNHNKKKINISWSNQTWSMTNITATIVINS